MGRLHYTEVWNFVTGCTKISPGCDKVVFHKSKLEEILNTNYIQAVLKFAFII